MFSRLILTSVSNYHGNSYDKFSTEFAFGRVVALRLTMLLHDGNGCRYACRYAWLLRMVEEIKMVQFR